MFESKSPMIKVGGYIIVGFFVLIIIISFGMPDFISRVGMDKSIVAEVNGEKVQYLDFLRYRDNLSGRIKDVNNKEVQRYILESLIRYRLQLQFADKAGIKNSDDKVKRSIKEISAFQDKSGKFNNQYLNNFLDHYHLSLNDYYVMVRDELTNAELMQMIKLGVGVAPDEVKNRNAIENSKLQIRYCYIPNNDLKKKFSDRISVTDKDVEDELKRNRSELKDPKTDRERVKNKILNRKFDTVKADIIKDIDAQSASGKTFDSVAAQLGGKISTSAVFKVGERLNDSMQKGNMLYALNESQVFLNDLLVLDIGKSSKAISSFDGLYVFTPIKKDIQFKDLKQPEYDAAESRVFNEKSNALYMSLMTSFMEKSKIKKNTNFD